VGVCVIWLLPSIRGPALPMRARRLGRRPGQLFGLSVGKRGATTLAIQRSLSGAWTMGQSVYRALTADSTATRNIQGARRTAPCYAELACARQRWRFRSADRRKEHEYGTSLRKDPQRVRALVRVAAGVLRRHRCRRPRRARQRLPTWSRYLPGSRPEPCGLARPDRQRRGDDSPPEGRRTHHADVLRFRRPAEGGPPLRAR